MNTDLLNKKYVYHYTGFDALFSILESYRKRDKKSLLLRASNIYKMNDPKEMEAGFYAVKHILPRYEAENNIHEDIRLSEVYNNVKSENACKEDYMKGRDNQFIDFGNIPYSISLSARGDYLPMWALYGQKGKGVCLEFDTFKLQDSVFDLGESYSLDKVVYRLKKGTRSLESLIDFLYQLCLNDTNNNKPTIEDKIGDLADLCILVSPYYKYQDYEYEQEVRLTYIKSFQIKLKDNNPMHGLDSHKIEEHIEIPIPINCLKNIIIGPDANYEVMKHILELELDNCGLNPNMIKQSKIAYKSK